MTQRTALYRAFDDYDRLVYVGISYSALARMEGHRYRRWWRDVTRITIEWYPTRETAKAAETRAIKTEQPLHNIAESDLTDEDREFALSSWGLFVHLEPRLDTLAAAVIQESYDYDDLPRDLSYLVGFERGGPLRSGNSEPVAVNDAMLAHLDVLESLYTDPLTNGEALLRSQPAFDWCLQYLRHRAGMTERSRFMGEDEEF